MLLSPVRPECAGLGGATEMCWGEWLKEPGTVEFTPVARGELAAGPWPTAELVTIGAGDGIDEGLVGVGVDTGQNQYAVSDAALFIRRSGETRFTKYPRNTVGLRDYRMLSVAGGSPGVAYLGYQGVFGPDPENDPPDVRKSGDVQEIRLTAAGIEATTWDTHNSNTPLSGKFDHSRSIFGIEVPRRGPAAGEVYLGTEHGIVRYQGKQYADHLHIATIVDGSQRFGSSRALTVRDDGTLWYGNDFAFGGKPWTPRLFEWYFDAPWIFPSYAFGSKEDRDYYEGVGVDSTGKNIWLAAREHGIAHLTISPSGRAASIETLSAADPMTRDLIVDLDDTLWVASDSGVHRYDPTTKTWTRLAGVGGGANDLFLDDTVTPRALYIATRGGLFVYRGP